MEVIANGFSKEEIEFYVKEVQSRLPKKNLQKVSLSRRADGDVDVDYIASAPKFERIRRITGYLVGTIDRWNDAKRAEEHDRVKHGC